MKNKIKFLPLLIIVTVIFLSIGYSAFNRDLIVGDIKATVRVVADIRLTGLNISDTNNAIGSSEDYNVHNIYSDVELPNDDSTITFKVSVTNFGSAYMGIKNITGLPDNLTYELSGYKVGDMICDSSDNCINGITKEFYITIKYKNSGNSGEDTDYTLNINFDFQEMFKINYVLNSGTFDDGINPIKGYFAEDGVDISEEVTRDGYVFNGWYENNSFTGNKVTTISGRNENITLYAKWNGVIYFQIPPDWYGENTYVKFSTSFSENKYNCGTETCTSADLMTLFDSDKKIYKYVFADNADLDNYKFAYFSNDITIEDSSGTKPRRALSLDISKEDYLGKVFAPEVAPNSTTEDTRVFGFATNFNFYFWKGADNNGWPGTAGTVIGKRIHYTTFKRNVWDNMIVNNRGSNKNQSADLVVPVYQDLTYRLTDTCNSSNICGHLASRLFYFGQWHDYDDWLDDDYDTWSENGSGARFKAAQDALGY